jgi:hypothetical protein
MWIFGNMSLITTFFNPSISFLLVFIEDVTYENSRLKVSRDYQRFFVRSMNYSVPPGLQGVFEIRQINLTDSWLILFTLSYNGSATVANVCPSIKNVSRHDILKVYDDTTTIERKNEPDSYKISNGTVLCSVHLTESRYDTRQGDTFVYTFKGTDNFAVVGSQSWVSNLSVGHRPPPPPPHGDFSSHVYHISIFAFDG